MVARHSAAKGRTQASHRALLDPAEPFRLFFPLALLIGLVGVALWPLYQLHLVATYPAVTHPRLMTEGFMAAFVFGFLGTAGPRMLSAPPLTRPGLALLLALHVAVAGCHLANRHTLGDALFLGELLVFAAMFAVRFLKRADLPPPAFVLVPLGFLAGISGAALLVVQTPESYQLGSRLLFEGFFLLPMLGIGTFLFPRFLGLPIPAAFPDSRTPPPGWWRAAAGPALCGLLILATYPMETAGSASAAIFARCAVAVAFLLPRVPVWNAQAGAGVVRPLRVAIVLLCLGLLLTALFPRHRIAMLHVLFIGGFGLTAMLVATRVMFGHSGCGQQLKKRVPFIIALVALTHASIVLRLAADLAPSLRMHLLATSGVLWIAGALVWAWRTVPKALIPDAED